MMETTKQGAINNISEAIEKVAGKKTLILVSGGSSAEIAVGALAKIKKTLRQNIAVILADERYVDYSSTESNGESLKKLGIQNYCNKFIEILSPNKLSANELTVNFCNNLEEQISKSTNVIAIFGVGTNNHIAGIFPNSVDIATNEKLATHYKAEDFERVTINPTVFEKINKGFIYAEGKNKKNAIQSLNQKYDIISHPSQLIKVCKEFEIFFNKEGL